MSRYLLIVMFGLWLGLWLKGTVSSAHGPTTVMAQDSVTGAAVFVQTDGSGALQTEAH